MKNEQLVSALRAGDGDGMWVERAVGLVESLNGTDIDPYSSTLLADMHAARFDHPQIGSWLFELPGHRKGDMETAEQHIGFLTAMINGIPMKGTGQ